MRVCFVSPRMPEGAIARYVELLGDVTVVLTEVEAQVPGIVGIDDAPECDVAVATSWDATIRLFEVPAKRYVYYVDELAHERLGSWQTERIAALVSYDLPVDFVCAWERPARLLAQQRPDARIERVRQGVETTQGGQDVLVHLDLDPRPVLDARASGTVPITLPEHEELVGHQETGILVTPEDERGTERWARRLREDRELLESLRSSPLQWPTWEESAQELRAALQRLLDTEPPATNWPVRLMADLMAGVAVYRKDHFVLAGELQRIEKDHAFQAAQKLRARWQSPRLDPLRKAARPLTRAAKKRLG